jgi:hypothetical protein
MKRRPRIHLLKTRGKLIRQRGKERAVKISQMDAPLAIQWGVSPQIPRVIRQVNRRTDGTFFVLFMPEIQSDFAQPSSRQ